MRIISSGLLLAALALGTACSSDSATGPSSGGMLTLGTALSVSGRFNSERYYTVVVPAGAPALRVTLSGGSGDADIFVRFNARPTESTSDCESTSFDNDEECIIPDPSAGTWHILVLGFEAYNGAQLLAEITAPATSLALGTAATVAGPGGNSERSFTVVVPAGAPALRVTLSGGIGDADILVRFNARPTETIFACESAGPGNNEECVIIDPAAGIWHILVIGFEAYSDAQLLGELTAVPVVTLTLGTPRTVSGPGGNSERYYTVEVPADAPALRVRLSGGSGDADLAIRFGAQPGPFAYDCGSFSSTNQEECIIASPTAGTWHILVIGFDFYTGAALLAELTAAPSVTALTSGVALTNQGGTDGSSRFFSITVPAGATSLVVTTSGGTGDVDLFARLGSLPAPGAANCESFNDGNGESCVVNAPAEGTWYVLLKAFEAYAGVTLTATVVIP